MRSAQYRLGLWMVMATVSAACARQNAIAVERPPLCSDGGCPTDGGGPFEDADKPPRDVPQAGSAAPGGRGGTGAAGAGAGGRGGAAAGAAGASDAGRADASTDAAAPPLAEFTLAVDAPSDGDALRGVVTVRGRAPGFKNVEVWDRTHSKPPLAQTTPRADSTFSLTIDVGALVPGSTTWTVYAWDSPPGENFDRMDSERLNLTIMPGQDGVPDPGTAYVPEGYRLMFSDEFAGGTLDTAVWTTLAPYNQPFYEDTNQKHAFIPQGVTLKDGIVTFTAQRTDGSNTGGQPYSSGSITTKRTFTHGYFEARVKVPEGKGLWPAFWMTSAAMRWPPEWDIFEIFENTIYGNRHPVAGGKCVFVGGAAGPDETYTIPNLYGVFHVYGFRWTESDLYSYVDGVLTEHYEIDAAAGANDPFWINLSLQVGGQKKNDPVGKPGDPDDTTPFPARMEVDYLRVYERE